jgi:hypothetical protein
MIGDEPTNTPVRGETIRPNVYPRKLNEAFCGDGRHTSVTEPSARLTTRCNAMLVVGSDRGRLHICWWD